MTPDSRQFAGLPVSLDEIRAAAARIQSSIVRTPVLNSEPLNAMLGAELWFKCENLQHIGAFKTRGACNAVFSLTAAEAAAGVVTHSSGNHAAALARAAMIRRIRAHVVMPRNSAEVKLAAVRRLGVTPILCEPSAESREATAREVISATGATLVHAYDDTRVIAGQGTIGLELLEQVDHLDVVVIPVGGGGLLAGMLIALKSLKPDLLVYAAEPTLADDAARSLRSGVIERPVRYDTIADGLRTPVGQMTFPVMQRLLDDILLVDEATIVEAAGTIQAELRVVAEPSGAVPLAAVMQHSGKFAGRRVAMVISGGNRDPAA